MDALKKIKFRLLFTTLLVSTLALLGCSQDRVNTMIGPVDGSTTAIDGGVLAKKGHNNGKGKDTGKGNKGKEQFPISVSRTFEFKPWNNFYEGGSITFGHKGSQSHFVLNDNALTPPTPEDWGQDIEITMEIDYDSTANDLLFSFGPHGCQFSPRAKVRLDFRKLGVDVAKLYYIDDSGDYILQNPEQISTHGKWMTISVDHFSRYALSAD